MSVINQLPRGECILFRLRLAATVSWKVSEKLLQKFEWWIRVMSDVIIGARSGDQWSFRELYIGDGSTVCWGGITDWYENTGHIRIRANLGFGVAEDNCYQSCCEQGCGAARLENQSNWRPHWELVVCINWALVLEVWSAWMLRSWCGALVVLVVCTRSGILPTVVSVSLSTTVGRLPNN